MVLIPAFNAAHCLGSTLQDFLSQVPPSQIWVINDGSTDTTAIIAEKMGVKVIHLPSNLGKGSALALGMVQAHQAAFRFALTVDADGQHRAKDLAAFFKEPLAESIGIVVGQRPISGSSMPWHRRFSNSLTTAIISRLAGGPVYDAQSGYRLYRTALVAQGLFPKLGRFEWESQALVLTRRAGYGISSVSVATVYSGQGSHMRIIRDTLRFLFMAGRLAWMR